MKINSDRFWCQQYLTIKYGTWFTDNGWWTSNSRCSRHYIRLIWKKSF